MFEMCGFPPQANYLFLGDYVDRGKQSLETILLLLCYKIKFPENFFLLRGNHECANVTRGTSPLETQLMIVYGFYDECKRRTNIKTWKTFIDVFNTLPIASIVASKIFCVHGGLSPSLKSMDDIRRIQRPTDVPDYGLLNDLVWSDPSDTAIDWEDNERGVSFCYGKSVINAFLATHVSQSTIVDRCGLMNRIWTLYVEHIWLWRMDTSFTMNGRWSPYFLHQSELVFAACDAS